MSCSAEMLPHVMYAECAQEAWNWLAEAGAWTELEKENYNKMLAKAARARANSHDIPENDKVLIRHNYGKWKIYMESVLISKYLWTVVDGSDTNISRSYKTKNHNALVIIRMSCGEEMFNHIDNRDDAKGAWCDLEDELGANTASIERRKGSYSCDHILFVMIDRDEILRVIVDDKSCISSNNYKTWVIYMKNYLVDQGLWGFLGEARVSNYVKDERALDAIKSSCAPEMRAYILYTKCAKDAWEKIATVADSKVLKVYVKHCKDVQESAIERETLNKCSEADKVLTRSNYQMWEKYVTMLLRSRFLADFGGPGFDDYSPGREIELRKAFSDYEIKEACALRIIKEACSREMIPYIFRSKSPREALKSLKKACSTDQKDDYMKYSRLFHAIQKNRFREPKQDWSGEIWRGAHKFFRDYPEALTDEITKDGSTALHAAVRLGRVDYVRELLNLMTTAQSEIMTHEGNTALAVAAKVNNMEIVKELVDWNPNLIQIVNGVSQGKLHAVTIAAINGNKKIMRYLYTPTEKSTDCWSRESVATLLTSALRLDAFDIVGDLLIKFGAGYALERDHDGVTLLSVLAEKPSAFPSGNQLGLLEGWTYWMDLCWSVENSFIFSYVSYLYAMHVTLCACETDPTVRELLNIKEYHDQTAAIVQRICSMLLSLNPHSHSVEERLIYDAVYRSTIQGIIEVFEILIDTNPYLLESFKDEHGRGLFQIAIMYRQDSIFRYMSQMGQRNQNLDLFDNYRNNALHCAAFWDPSSKLVHGPALQMQRELQWFQEVEKVVPPRYKETKNNDQLTPKALFSLQHRDLAKEAEKWMKDMAQACIIVTALIATVMFAAPFTLPGGTDQDTGVSLALESTIFKIFIVSDVSSLCMACASLLFFLSILTARYEERDFLESLPWRLILGLLTLFISIATMMLTFTATILIVLRGDFRAKSFSWLPFLAFIPILIFAGLQFPLFVNLIISTNGLGIFRSKRVVLAPLDSIGYGDAENHHPLPE
ncbi:hypothetical protein MKW92_027871 [Papaver armeniacum]|nr:hypothetical protein MKW92_027871 [Papaver armeniacum]